MNIPNSEWLVALQGHPFDLEYCKRSLKAPFDPFCDEFSFGEVPVLCLRSLKLQGFDSAEAAKPSVESLIECLNGAMRIHSRTEPLTLKGIGKLDDAGQFYLTSFMMGRATARSMAAGTLEAYNPDGTRVPSAAPAESDVQRWLRAADTNDDVADLLAFVGRAWRDDNWFDVYKALEAAEVVVGNSENKLIDLMKDEAGPIKIMKRTANRYRHARIDPHLKPMLFSDATNLLLRLMRAALSHKGL